MRRGSTQSGLTLIELLISVALLGFVLLGIAPLFIASVKANYSANEYTSIHIMARDRLEQLMNLPFNDPRLNPGVHPNDQPTALPDPTDPSALSTVRNPFSITHQVFQFAIPAAAGIPTGGVFTPTRVTAGGATAIGDPTGLPYDYKRIDVTVTAGAGPLGIGTRISRVSGILSNPAHATPLLAPCGAPGIICSVADTCAYGTTTPCCTTPPCP